MYAEFFQTTEKARSFGKPKVFEVKNWFFQTISHQIYSKSVAYLSLIQTVPLY